jgi:hypothetical protein
MLNVKVGDYIKVEDGGFWMVGTVSSLGPDWNKGGAYLIVESCADKGFKVGTELIVLATDTITHLNVELENE